MLARTIYYSLKPVIPTRVQTSLRKYLVKKKLNRCAGSWPIDILAGAKPKNWGGWPEGKQFALVLTHDVETLHGFYKTHALMKLEQDLGFHSSFNFVPERCDLSERYKVSAEILEYLNVNGFEVGVHGLKHDGKLYSSRKAFKHRAKRINHYLSEWGAVGFRSPAMHHNLKWLHDLHIEYDLSTFDTDPFEPQPEGMRTIFPFTVDRNPRKKPYVEMPYTLPQDSTLFLFMGHTNCDIWKEKLEWIVEKGGMALLNTHPDYMNFTDRNHYMKQYPSSIYEDFLRHVQKEYAGLYWHALPRDVARFWRVRQSLNAAEPETIKDKIRSVTDTCEYLGIVNNDQEVESEVNAKESIG